MLFYSKHMHKDVSWMDGFDKLSLKNILKDLVFDLKSFSACFYKGAARLTFYFFFNVFLGPFSQNFS